jgi:hypothetical protein
MEFEEDSKTLYLGTAVITGLDALDTRTNIESIVYPRELNTVNIFIEKYRPRSGFATDEAMLVANSTFNTTLAGSVLLSNMGVKQTVSKTMLEALHLWSFDKVTHHQDLRSAARIGVLGMLLDPVLNKTVFQFLTDHLDGRPWDVRWR